MWTCPGCGEQSEANFGTCWNCEADRPEGIDLDERRKTQPVNCPRCGAKSRHTETKYFHEEKPNLLAIMADTVLHNVSDLFAERRCLDVYLCPKCDFEFFVDHKAAEAMRAV